MGQEMGFADSGTALDEDTASLDERAHRTLVLRIPSYQWSMNSHCTDPQVCSPAPYPEYLGDEHPLSS